MTDLKVDRQDQAVTPSDPLSYHMRIWPSKQKKYIHVLTKFYLRHAQICELHLFSKQMIIQLPQLKTTVTSNVTYFFLNYKTK